MLTQTTRPNFSSVAVMLIALCCGVFTATVSLAQNAPAAPPAKGEVPAPPKPRNLDEPLEPQVTIRKIGNDTHEEYRIGGKLYMIKVTPAGAPPYYLIDRNGRGNFVRGEGPGTTSTSVPQWVLFEF